ncbi:MAG: hypothetical protein ACK46A_03695 [Akkermansiaceae bacterium]|jgi:hypothetical protein|nr:hypothetical protein [Luteolibacter sp.]
MSNDSQTPENFPNGNPPDFPADISGYNENDLWELGDSPNEFPKDLKETKKSYGIMEKPVSTDDSQNAPTPPVDTRTFYASLTGLEKISLFAIVATFAISAVLAIIHFSKEIPIDSKISKIVKLPIEGKILTITTVETYWRKPNSQGESIDVVKRGAILIPNIKMTASGKSGAIRIFFRDSDGTLVGDSTTLAISGTQDITISATDGFSDIGMHASYRTGEHPRWMIQAFEGPSVDAPIENFHPIFETEISTDIR